MEDEIQDEAKSSVPFTTHLLSSVPTRPSFLVEQFNQSTKERIFTEEELKGLDGRQRLSLRIPVVVFFGWLLIIQHVFVYSIILASVLMGTLKDLQLIFGTLAAGTIGETMFIVHTIVNWMFGKEKSKK